MSKYLFIESRDPFESAAVRDHVELAVGLSRAGHRVAFYLVQNGVLPCRAGANGEELNEALTAGIELLADDFSLRERGIGDADLARGVRPAAIDAVVDRLAGGWKVLFV
jgi:sulfur relay (sulfurtransferase) DsrF/TusC family protein